ncbi:MAG TPA: allantoate amidohydrolase [Intrasporangium sp.]|nr:allantoate amidohydrolase [Intrasporangium sp.]
MTGRPAQPTPGSASALADKEGSTAQVLTGFDSMWQDLSPLGRDGRTGGYHRYAWTWVDHELREWFSAQAAARGLDVHLDRSGNQWAWWGDPDAGVAAGRPGLVLGSHLDSVPDGGAFDGPLGVVSAFAALDLLRARGVAPERPIGIVNFADEEGARFGIACTGSRLLTGALSRERALAARDQGGTSLAEALRDAGQEPRYSGADSEALRRIGTFIELHVEQGRALEDLDRPVAVGESILPHGRWRLEFDGDANHAGTTRLADRNDPMLGLAAAINSARIAAEVNGCLATVGKVHVEPNGVNAIASRAVAWLDARGSSEHLVRLTADQVARHSGGGLHEESFTAVTHFDQRLARQLAHLLDDAPILSTGAGHDAGILAQAGVPAAMIFVRNPTGVSHSPAEHAEVTDCHAGVLALTEVAGHLAGSLSR